MTYSLGEVEALCRKAARGAGFSWGMADEAGKTARWLCQHGLPGTAALAGYLDTVKTPLGPDDPNLQDWSTNGTLCPLICGALLSDMGPDAAVRYLHKLAWPILIMPHIENRRATILDDVSRSLDPLLQLANLVLLEPARNTARRPSEKTTRAMITTQDLATLTRLAARTYAPETDASKLSGAGAGLKDED